MNIRGIVNKRKKSSPYDETANQVYSFTVEHRRTHVRPVKASEVEFVMLIGDMKRKYMNSPEKREIEKRMSDLRIQFTPKDALELAVSLLKSCAASSDLRLRDVLELLDVIPPNKMN